MNDRGPYVHGRIVDLSYTAAYKLGVLKGVAPVELTRITFDDIRTGAWRKGAVPEPAPVEDATVVAAAPPATNAPIAPAAPIAPGTSPPAADPVTAAPAASAPSEPSVDTSRPARGYWVQLGAFRQKDGADSFQRRVGADLDWLAPLLAVFTEPGGYRLQAGPYASREEAQGVAKRVRDALSLVPVVVDRR